MKRERSVLLSIVLFSLYLSLIVCEIRVTPDGTRVNEEGDEVFHVKERSANAEATLCAQGTFLYYYTSSYVGECVPQYNSATASYWSNGTYIEGGNIGSWFSDGQNVAFIYPPQSGKLVTNYQGSIADNTGEIIGVMRAGNGQCGCWSANFKFSCTPTCGSYYF